MIQTKTTRLLAGALAALMLVLPGGLSVSADSAGSGSSGNSGWETPSLAELLNTVSYEEYLAKNQNVGAGKDGATISGADITKFNESLTNAAGVTALKVGETDALYLPSEGAVGWNIEIPSDGKYMIKFNYAAVENDTSKTTAIERSIYINESIPFYEARFLTMSKVWEDSTDSFQHWEGKSLYRYIKDGKIVYPFVDDDNNTYELDVGKSGEYKNKMIFKKVGKVEASEIEGAERYPVFSTDINGNEIKADKNLKVVAEVDFPSDADGKMGIGELRTYVASDSTGYYVDPLQFVFKKGTNTIQLEAQREAMVIYSIEVVPYEQYMSYDEYIKYCKENYNATEIKEGANIKVQAEYTSATSENTLCAFADRTSYSNEPQNASALLLNSIGGEGGEKWQNVGQWARYSVTVPKSGFYRVSLRFRQGVLEGTFSSRTLRVATSSMVKAGKPAEIPFYEAQYLQFNYGDDWQMESLNSGNTNKTYLLYLEEGENYLEFEASLGNMAEILRQVENAMDTINSVYIKIRMITGTNPDTNVDYGFYRIMADDLDELQRQRTVLLQVAKDFQKQTGTTGSHAKTLETVATLLERMKKEDKIASNLDNLKENLGTLGTWLQNSKNQPLEIDYLLVGPTTGELPRATDTLWQTLKFEVTQFVRSFSADYNSLGSTEIVDDENVIHVWTTLARDQAQIIRNLINSDFNKNNPGVSVELKLVAGGSLLPSILAGVGPDVSMGHGAGDIINWAIRSAVQELNGMEGLEEVVGTYDPLEGFSGGYFDENQKWQGAWFTAAALEPLTLFAEYDETVKKEPEALLYGLPETQSFSMMFYRADIFKDLGLEVPETWDDLIAILPHLQNNNMQVALPSQLGGLNLFLYQMGGDLYADGGQKISFEDNTTLTAFEYMCEFFSAYRCPYTYDFANRFRTGEIPMGIMDYTSYTQLSIYATEIKGLWEFVPLPGWQTIDEAGNTHVDNTALAGVSAMIMVKDEDRTKEQEKNAWTFMKWFVSENNQSAYANELTTLLGTVSKHATANVRALESLSWTTSEYTNLMKQFTKLDAVREYPGGYIIGRYVSFAFLAVYNNNANPVDELQSYVVTINKELTRKRQEFNMKVPADAID